jgi:hypothetical protein
MDGLSAEKMKVLLHPHDKNKLMVEEPQSDDKLVMSNTRDESNQPSPDFLSFKDSIVLTTMQDGTRGKWKRAQAGFLIPKNIYAA